MDRLYKSSTERMLFGVCGGLAVYFDVDPVVVRAAFAVLAFAGGLGLILYVILAIIMPDEAKVRSAQAAQPGSTSSEPGDGGGAPPDSTTGIDQSPAQPAQGVSNARSAPELQTRRRQAAGVILIVVGALWLLSNLGGFFWFRWDLFWPAILIAAGVVIIAGRLRRQRP